MEVVSSYPHPTDRYHFSFNTSCPYETEGVCLQQTALQRFAFDDFHLAAATVFLLKPQVWGRYIDIRSKHEKRPDQVKGGGITSPADCFIYLPGRLSMGIGFNRNGILHQNGCPQSPAEGMCGRGKDLRSRMIFTEIHWFSTFKKKGINRSEFIPVHHFHLPLP